MALDNLPKSEWGPGPWQEEPDRLEFESHGFPCLLQRNNRVTGSWCGYVALPPGHPYFEKPEGAIDVNVHGGLTYAEHCQGVICHKPKAGEPDQVWWLGFDCAHAFDFSPRMNKTMEIVLGRKPASFGLEHYWTLEEVTQSVKHLAEQLNQVTSDRPAA